MKVEIKNVGALKIKVMSFGTATGSAEAGTFDNGVKEVFIEPGAVGTVELTSSVEDLVIREFTPITADFGKEVSGN